MLEIVNLTKNFGSLTAVSEANFSITKPQMIGIIGRSGAGKSSLLRMINRLLDATSGEIIHSGINIRNLKGKGKRKWQKECAMIFQQFNLVPRLNVLTNVLLGGLNQQPLIRSLLSIFTQEERNKALKILDRFGIVETALQRAETLSGGQQQRVAICRALMQSPKMILADEPIASLDPLNAKLVMEALRNIHIEEKITVVCNLHTLDTAKKYCDRIIGMKAGKIVFDDAPLKLTQSKTKHIYGADEDDDFNSSVTSTSLG